MCDKRLGTLTDSILEKQLGVEELLTRGYNEFFKFVPEPELIQLFFEEIFA